MARGKKLQRKAAELDEARLRELIACKAHELYEQRGSSPGRDLDDPPTCLLAEGEPTSERLASALRAEDKWGDDWLEAERLVRQELRLQRAGSTT